MTPTRLPFELDVRAEAGALTAHGGVPLLIEALRTSGAAAALDERVVIKQRGRGLAPPELVEGLFSLWPLVVSAARIWRRCARTRRWRCCSGTACRRRRRPGIFLEAFDEATPPLWQAERAAVQSHLILASSTACVLLGPAPATRRSSRPPAKRQTERGSPV